MANNRINYACNAVGIKKVGDTGPYTPIRGAQTFGLSTVFNNERYFELGQSEIYQNIEDIPDISITINKFLDGHPLVYLLATEDAPTPTLLGRQNEQSIVAWTVVDDTSDSVSGTAIATVESSGCFVSSLAYNFTVDGPFTEDITLVSNHAFWSTGGTSIFGNAFTGTIFDNTDTPLNIAESGGLQTRERLVFNGQADITLLPRDINGISTSGTNGLKADGHHIVHVQNISITAELGRENALELGKKTPYFRAITLPVDIDCTIEVNSTSGNYISATEAGVYGNGNNTRDEAIKVVLQDGTIFDLGTRNKLQNVDYGGGGTDGAFGTDTYTYQGANRLTVTQNFIDP